MSQTSQTKLNDIDLHYAVTYLSSRGTDIKWRNEDYTTMNMVKAIKGEPLKGYFEISLNGQTKRIDNANSSDFRKICHQPLVRIIEASFIGPHVLVPIPSSKTTSVDQEFTAKAIANQIAASKSNAFTCSPILFFKNEVQSSRAGGGRNPYSIEDNMALSASVDSKIILIDDVFTTGAHLKAACWKLHASGMNVVGAVCFARTVFENSQPAFGHRSDKIDVSRPFDLFEF